MAASSPSTGSMASTPAPDAANTFTPAPRPSLCMKPMPMAVTASPVLNAGSPTGSLTTKEWIVPPRPKPGRKPATDTPPTKRKAQNRAAQRAFRERRAARVSELEDQIKHMEDDHEEQADGLRSQNNEYEKEIQRYRNELGQWRDRCRQLEEQLAAAKQDPSHSSLHRNSQLEELTSQSTAGCGNCSLETRCQCIDAAFDALDDGSREKTVAADRSTILGRTSNKRVKVEHAEDMEIDFTTAFSKPSHGPVTEAASSTSAVPDPCGFCSQGTTCICAEMAADRETQIARNAPSQILNERQLAQFTPPPSEGDVANIVNVPAPSNSACAAGPGSCTQCRADPNSTLFCKSLAVARSKSGLPTGCCGGKNTNGECCQDSVPLPMRNTRSKASARPQPTPMEPSAAAIKISCADAYTTLSRHPKYSKAAEDFGSWMPKLLPTPTPAQLEGRGPMEMDAAGVMIVMRDWDRRFGKER